MTLMVLNDGWPDAGPESFVWVEVDPQDTGGVRAVEAARAELELDGYIDELDDAGAELVQTGRREWLREAPCQSCDGSGADGSWRYRLRGVTLGGVEDVIGPDPACESCGGDGRQTGDEGLAYRICDLEEPGAVEFWVLEVRERQAA